MTVPNLQYQADQIPLQFLDHRRIEWARVRRSHVLIHQRLQYHYPSPARELHHRLVVVPSEQHGQQLLCEYQLNVSLPVHTQQHLTDDFGNRIFKFYIPEIETRLEFDVWSKVKHTVDGAAKPIVPAEQIEHYRQATQLTAIDASLTAIAQELNQLGLTPWQLAQRINNWTYNALRYERGITTVQTTAPEALSLGAGLCQDFSHVMLAICRAAGLPARYVSGHLLGEGASHAWVEVLLHNEQTGNFEAWALDPTNHCEANHKYVTIAVGRDYADVSPTSGSFIADRPGSLTINKRAGLTAVEYTDGELLQAEASAETLPKEIVVGAT